MDATNLTRRQIEDMQAEASAAGDYQMADLCEWALDGCPIALQAVATRIREAVAAAAATPGPG